MPFPLRQVAMCLREKPVFRLLSIQESWRGSGFLSLSWFPLAVPMDPKLVQNVPVATNAEWKELIHPMGTRWWKKWSPRLVVSCLYSVEFDYAGKGYVFTFLPNVDHYPWSTAGLQPLHSQQQWDKAWKREQERSLRSPSSWLHGKAATPSFPHPQQPGEWDAVLHSQEGVKALGGSESSPSQAEIIAFLKGALNGRKGGL